MIFNFKSKVIFGKGIGRTLGFPTANLVIPGNFDLPEGVYASEVFWGNKRFLGALFYGKRGDFQKEGLTLEVHLLDFTGEMKGEELEVLIKEKIREVEVFSSKEELIKQIGEDCRKVKGLGL